MKRRVERGVQRLRGRARVREKEYRGFGCWKGEGADFTDLKWTAGEELRGRRRERMMRGLGSFWEDLGFLMLSKGLLIGVGGVAGLVTTLA